MTNAADYIQARVIAALARHIGASNGISCELLAMSLFADPAEHHKRRVRSAIEQLRREGHAICGHPGTGYYIASNADELDGTCEFLYSRAMTTLTQIAAMKRISMPDLRGQFHLPT